MDETERGCVTDERQKPHKKIDLFQQLWYTLAQNTVPGRVYGIVRRIEDEAH